MSRYSLKSRQAFWLAGLCAAAGYVCAVIGTGQIDVHVPALIRSIAKFLWSEESAGWAAAIGTVAAVWVALTASRKEHERALQLRNDEWDRTEARQREWARRLARALHKELWFANSDLEFIEYGLNPAHPIEAVQQFMAHEMQQEPLPLLTRFIDQVECFSRTDAAALLNMLTIWRTFTRPSSRAALGTSEKLTRQRAGNITKRSQRTRKVIRELQAQLEPYFADDPGMKFVEESVSFIKR
nr:hypothetical protein [uncultured Pseudoxanthomonas sp.]